MFWRKPGWRGMQTVLYYLIAIRACLVYLYRSVIQCRKGGEKWMRNYNRSVGFSSIYYFRLTLSRRARSRSRSVLVLLSYALPGGPAGAGRLD